MKYLAFDIRALALMRIGIAATIMYDLAIRLTDLEAFYSNTGVVPLDMLFTNAWNDFYVSVHAISGLWQVQLGLFLLSFFFASMLFVGYRTRLFTFLSWFMMVSLHNRNGLILQGGDDLLRLVLFWAMFLPWGARYSCDSLLDFKKDPSNTIRTPASFAYLLQICYIYTGSALLKGPEWHSDLNALYYTYSLDQIAYPVTKMIYYYENFLKVITLFVYYFELFIPLLFFIPIKHGIFRLIAVLTICLFHLINGCTLLIGLFPLIGIVTVIGILPERFMSWFEWKTTRLRSFIGESFTNVASYLRYLIKWKKPVYRYAAWYDNTRNAFLIFLIVFVFDWNFSNTTITNSKLSDNFRFIGYSLRLDQSWGMFAPGVFKEDGWYIHEGITANNEHVDLLNPTGTVHYRKPASVTAMFKNDRWRKYTENYIFNDNEFMRGYFCNYSKRKWNEDHSDKPLKTLRIIYMKELTLPGYKYSYPQKNILWECED